VEEEQAAKTLVDAIKSPKSVELPVAVIVI
jgi:hypothetical protein